jgi:hypothetical protein
VRPEERPSCPWQQESVPAGTCSESGAEVTQLTTAPLIHTHIYPEAPVFTPDSRFFVYARFQAADEPHEYWLCEVGSWRLFRLTQESPVSGPVVGADGEHLYYVSELRPRVILLIRLHLASLRREELAVAEGLTRPYPLGTMSPDGRYYATRVFPADGTASILRFDVTTGEARVIHSHPEIFNAHMQWEPGRGRDILIQHNRGGVLDERGRLLHLTGPQGGTLYLIDAEGGNARPLAIGTPHSPRIQGHQCWLGRTGKVLATLGGDFTRDGKKGNLVTIAEGDEAPTVVAGGPYFCHVSASPDGRFFICDEQPGGDVLVGSTETGRFRLLCRSGSAFGAPQYTHPHPFLSPDGRYAFFNSIRTGVPQIYACRVPAGLLESLAP